MIELNSVEFEYLRGNPIIKRLDLKIGQGEAWAVIGPSGCGKSTLLYLLAGLRLPTRGSIYIAGGQLVRPRPKTGLILQDYGLLPWATCEQNISLGLRLRKYYGPDGKHAPDEDLLIDERSDVEYWLQRLDLGSVRRQFPSQLSGGQRQRTAIARTLVLRPDILLMDEPYSSLDAPTREKLQDLLIDLRIEQGLTTVVVTHLIDEAAYLGKKILLLGEEIETIKNPNSGRPEFRSSREYQDVCDYLRTRLSAAIPSSMDER